MDSDWESRYRGQAKPQLRDFLDEEEEDSVVLRMQTSVHQDAPQSAVPPATYPESYQTLDRRRKRKIRDPGGLRIKEGCPSDLALPRETRGEVFLRQVAAMQDEEERSRSCLRPYNHGLLYKTRMWAKNEVDSTLENYVAFKKEQDGRRRSRFEFEFQDRRYSFESEEESADLPLTDEDFPPEDSPFRDRFSYLDGPLENGLREKKCGKAKLGGWATEAVLSPVEEPSDEYVDTMDELQCLVESVSEYLAEKEEEISRYASLPRAAKSRLSSTDPLGEAPDKEPQPSSHQSPSAVQNTMSSLFTSITKGVGGGSKKADSPPAAPSAPPSQSGLTKLLFFIPKPSSSAPVAVVSPVESSPEKSFTSKAKTRGDRREAEIPAKSQTQRAHVSEYEGKGPGTPQHSALGKLNPLRLFSSGDAVSSTPARPQWDQSRSWKVTTAGEGRTPEETHLGQEPNQRTNNRQTPTNSKQENGSSPAPARTASQGQSANGGLLSPLKRSLSSLISPVAPVQPQVPVAVYPVFKSPEEPRLEEPADSGRLTPPFRSSPAQHSPNPQRGPPAFQGFPSSEDARASEPAQNRAQDSTSTQSSAEPQESNERRWLSHLFNPTPAPPTGNQAYPSNQNLQNSSGQSGSQEQHPSNQKQAAGEPQGFLTGLFKGHSAEDVSQPKQGGLLSGILKFAATSDISAEASTASTQRSSSPPQNPAEPCSPLPQRSEAHRQRSVSLETSQEPQQKGLLSGLLKFAPSENIPSSQPNQGEERNQHRNLQGPHAGSQWSQPDVDLEVSKPGFPGEQRAPTQQPASQQSGVLSGLLKFASADNMNAHQQSQTSKATHEGAGARNNQPHGGSAQKPGGLLSGLFKSSTGGQQQEQEQQSRSSQEMLQTKDLSSQSAEVPAETPGVLSGLFNKLTRSSENTDVRPSRPWSDPSQVHAIVTQQVSLEEETRERRIPTTAQQGFLTGLLNKAVTEPWSPKQAQTSGNNTHQQIPPATLPEIPSGLPKSVSTDFRQGHPPLLSASLNQRHSRHASLGGPRPPWWTATVDSETLDLRTSATFARSLQSQSKYSSVSTGNLSHLCFSASLPSAQPVAYSTGDIGSPLQHQTSPLLSTPPPACGSSSSLLELDGRFQGQLSPYGVSPSDDEDQWIRQSVFWQQFQNESVNFQVLAADQGQRQSDEGPALAGSSLRHSFSNIYQPYTSTSQLQGACQQEQTGTHPSDVQRNFETFPKKRLWSSYEDLGDLEYPSNDYGALNLTTKQSNGSAGKRHSFSNDSSYSLNGVSYHEGYYEEMPPNLSYSANWQHEVDDDGQHSFQSDFQNQFTSNGLIHPGYPPSAKGEAESLYLQDAEWYQQWLSLLEQGMWWPADDGDCGYFVYTDQEYVYALLTDAAGEYVYVCAPEGEAWGEDQRDGLPSAWLHNKMVCVCGFKVPLSNEDELLWLPGQHQGHSQLLNAPLDLSTAYRKGNQIMNLSLEQFSQMFEDSVLSQCQRDVDFTSYTLNKVKMDPTQLSYAAEDQCKDIVDLSCHSQGHIGSNWNNSEIRTLLSQKVAVSLNSSPTAYPNHEFLHHCYQPSHRRRPSTAVTVKHVDDVLEEEWRKRVSPGPEMPNRQVKKISSLISSFASKASPGEPNQSRPSSDDHKSKNVLSSGLHSLKSKIMKEEAAAVVSEPQSVKEPAHKAATTQGRVLPTVPTAARASQPSVPAHAAPQKTRLPRQRTVEQAAPPPQPQVPLGQKQAFSRPGQVTARKTTGPPEENPSEQAQTGLMNLFKSAVGVEEPKLDPQIGSKTSPHQQSNSGSSQGGAPSNKEATGVSHFFGSISSLFGSEPSSQQTQAQPSSAEGSLASPMGNQRQQTPNHSGLPQPTPSQPPNKSVSQVFQAPRPSTGLPTSRSDTLAPSEQPKDEGAKPASGLFGFFLGEMLSASATAAQSGPTPLSASTSAPQEESIGQSLLSIISGSNQNQSSPRTEPAPQASPSQADSQPSQAESVGKSILSLFGGSSFTSHPPQTKPPAEVSQQGSVPPKEPANPGFLSLFSGPSTQQAPGQTGSLLGGLLPGSSASAESPVKGLFSIFGDPTPPQTQPPPASSQHGTTQSHSQHQPESKPQAQPQSFPSVLEGILGGLSSNESPRKSLFSMFSSPGSTQTSGAAGNTDFSTPKGTSVPKEPSNQPVFNEVSSSQQGPSSPLGTVPTGREPPISSLHQGSSEISSASSSHVSVPEGSSAVVEKPSSASAVNTSSQARNAESSSDQNEVSSQASPLNVPPSKHPHVSSVLPGSGPQTPSSQNGSNSDAPKTILPQSRSVVPEVPEPPGPKDTSVKSLFSLFGGSAPQPSPQSGGSLLGAMFGGSSAQPTASQTGAKLLGGLFAGSAPPPCAPKGGGGAPQPAGPQSGTTVLGGLFGGSTTQAAGSQTAGSLLGGLLGGSAAGPQPSNANQAKPQNAASVLGGLLGGSFQTSKEQTPAGLLGGIFSGAPAATEVPEKSQSLASEPPSTPLPAPPPTLTDTTSVSPQKSSDGVQAAPGLGRSEQAADNVGHTKAQEEGPQQPGRSGENLPNVDVCVTPEGLTPKTDKASWSKGSDIEAEPAEPEELSSQLGQGMSSSKMEQEKLSTASASPVGQEHLPEAQKPVVDSSADAVKSFMSSLFKPAAEGPQQQQKSSLFGGAEAQAANSQAAPSLLAGIFGGSTADPAAPQTGVSLLGGLFKASGSQTQASNAGGSLLGGMFGGGPPGGPAAPAPPAGSLLSGIFGGASAQTDAAQTGASVLGGLGGALFGGIGKTSKPPEPTRVETKPPHGPSAQTQVPNESVVPRLSPPRADTDKDSQKTPSQEQPHIQTASTAVGSELCPEKPSVPPSPACEPIEDETEKGRPALEGELIHVKPSVFKESGSQSSAAPSAGAEPPAKSVFGFISAPTSAGKSLGSLFSPAFPSVPLPTAQSEGGSGLFSGLKTLSGGLFQEEKPVSGNQEPPTTSLFGTKMSFPWQTEQNAQASPVVVSQPTSHKGHTEQKLPPSAAPKTQSVGSADEITTPEICISTPDVDPSATLTPEEKGTVVERPPSAGPSSGVQLDNQPNMELLNAKRPVEA